LRSLGQTSLGQIERIFAGEGGKQGALFRKGLKYDKRNAEGYPCPVQLGALNDPCDVIEAREGWLLKYIDLAIKYNQPTRISTKGTILKEKIYLDKLSQAPHLFWVAFSIISPDDELMRKVDRGAPVPTERLETMKALSQIGVKTSLRFRPIFPGISDSTSKEPHAWKVLIDKAVAAGAIAISYEVGFYPRSLPPTFRKRWDDLSFLSGVPLKALYAEIGGRGVCQRVSYTWTEQIMHAVKEHAMANGLQVGVSDPVWKELTESGCCCGILPNDPVFGNWQRENMTNQLLESKRTGKVITFEDSCPPWAYDVPLQSMINLQAGPLIVYKSRHDKWADRLECNWYNLKSPRSPLGYFQGALELVKLSDGALGYKFKGLERRHPTRTPYWNL